MIKTIFAAVDSKPEKDLDEPLGDAVLKKIKEFQLKIAVDLPKTDPMGTQKLELSG